jgi:asparagine synthase (glutamine-hydrolysing)
MCGICGATGAHTQAEVEAMNARMHHRGPDDEGTYLDPEAGVALGARRLSIIDLEGGHQPLSNEDGTVWAVLNGEIYNHPELRRALKGRGHRLATRTDTEVLVHLWEDHRDALVHALEGMYAFAIWDTRDRTLFLARDRFGEKPLFYDERDGDLVFASELTALLAAGRTPVALDPATIDSFFVFGYVPNPTSVVSGVRQLPPASTLTWRPGGETRVREYWSPPMSAAETTLTPTQAADEVEGLLDRSVRSRMIADVPLGVLLSGGVDSTLIAVIAARASSEPIKTFTVGYDVGEVNEFAAARTVARQLGSDHHEVIIPTAEVLRDVTGMIGRLDQPIADPALVAMRAVATFARRHVTVAIGGEGADELFGGYPRYRWLARAQRLERALPPAVAAASAGTVRGTLSSPRARRLADVLAPADQLERHLDWVTADRRRIRGTVYGGALREHAESSRPLQSLRRLYRAAGNGDVAGRFMRLDQQHWLPDDVLAKADRASMQTSLEVRTPYLTPALAEFAASAPTALHLRGGGKHLLRRVLRGHIPRALAARPKTAFRVPVSEWLRGPLLPEITSLVDGGRLVEEGWIDREAVCRLVREHAAGSEHGDVLWPVFTLAIWRENFPGERG